MADDNQEERKNNSRAETEQRLHRFTILVYESAVQIMDIFAMPTESNIEMLFKLSLGLFGITGIAQLCRLYTFLSWQGTLLNLLLVAVLMIKEKGEQNVLTQSYKLAAQRMRSSSKKSSVKSATKKKHNSKNTSNKKRRQK